MQTTTVVTKSGKTLRIRIMRGNTTCHAVLVARNGRVVAECDVRPRDFVEAAERDAIDLAARI